MRVAAVQPRRRGWWSPRASERQRRTRGRCCGRQAGWRSVVLQCHGSSACPVSRRRRGTIGSCEDLGDRRNDRRSSSTTPRTSRVAGGQPRHGNRALDGPQQEARRAAGPAVGGRRPGGALLRLDRLLVPGHRRGQQSPALDSAQDRRATGARSTSRRSRSSPRPAACAQRAWPRSRNGARTARASTPTRTREREWSADYDAMLRADPKASTFWDGATPSYRKVGDELGAHGEAAGDPGQAHGRARRRLRARSARQAHALRHRARGSVGQVACGTELNGIRHRPYAAQLAPTTPFRSLVQRLVIGGVHAVTDWAWTDRGVSHAGFHGRRDAEFTAFVRGQHSDRLHRYGYVLIRAAARRPRSWCRSSSSRCTSPGSGSAWRDPLGYTRSAMARTHISRWRSWRRRPCWRTGSASTDVHHDVLGDGGDRPRRHVASVGGLAATATGRSGAAVPRGPHRAGHRRGTRVRRRHREEPAVPSPVHPPRPGTAAHLFVSEEARWT